MSAFTSTAIVATQLPFSMLDPALEDKIRDILYPVEIYEIVIRKIVGRGFKVAFIKFWDSVDAVLAVKVLSSANIDGAPIHASMDFRSSASAPPRRDSLTSSTSSASSNSMNDTSTSASSYSERESESTSSSSPSNFTLPPFPSLLKLHIAPIPASIPNSDIMSYFDNLLFKNFHDHGGMKVDRKSDYAMCFVAIYNFSDESPTTIIKRLSKTVIHGNQIRVQFQKDPRTCYYEPSEFEAKIRWENFHRNRFEDSIREGNNNLENISNTYQQQQQLQLNPNEFLQIHLSPLPDLHDEQLESVLESFLKKNFNDEGMIRIMLNNSGTKFAFVDLFNRSLTPTNVLLNRIKVSTICQGVRTQVCCSVTPLTRTQEVEYNSNLFDYSGK